MPAKDFKELREQIKAKRPDWDEAKIDQAARDIYMRNPAIIQKAPEVSKNDLNQKLQNLKPGESMELPSQESEEPSVPLQDRLKSGIEKLSAMANPVGVASGFPNEQAKIEAMKRIQELNSPKPIGPSSSDLEFQDAMRNAFRGRK